MTVVWMNEAALDDLVGQSLESVHELPIETAIPMAKKMNLPEKLVKTVTTGAAQHLQADLFSTNRGSVMISTSVYRLPDGKLLVLTENSWQAKPRKDR